MATQFMSEGSGGIAEVARMTAKSLAKRFPLRALACQDAADFTFDATPVRGFANSRPRFVAGFVRASLGATHIVHDFVGTARVQALSLRRSRPNALWAHGIELWGEARPQHLAAIRRADLVLVNSAYTMARAERALAGARSLRLCHLGTTSDAFPETIGPAEGPPTVLLLGRIDPLFPKGHDLLVSIWPKVVSATPGARLVFAGGGPALAQARELAARSPVAGSIEVMGFATPERMEAIWRRATILAMPSSAEGFGLVFVEAMRRGLPVIASLLDAGQEINLDGVTGFNLARHNPDRLTEAIVTLLRDRDLAARMGAAGHARWRDAYRFSAFDQRLQAAMADFLAA